MKKFLVFVFYAFAAFTGFAFADDSDLDVVIVNPSDLAVYTFSSVGTTASINGRSSQLAIIEKDTLIKESVFFMRTFENHFATIMLPFGTTPQKIKSKITFYRFAGMKKENGKYQAVVTDVTDTILPYKPYVVKSSTIISNIKFECPCLFKANPDDYSMRGQKLDENDNESEKWAFVGVNQYKTWGANDEELGRVYGYVGNNGNEGLAAGMFAKIGAGAYIYSMRGYLRYEGSPAARPANGMARPKAYAELDEDDLPMTIDVIYTPSSSASTDSVETETPSVGPGEDESPVVVEAPVFDTLTINSYAVDFSTFETVEKAAPKGELGEAEGSPEQNPAKKEHDASADVKETTPSSAAVSEGATKEQTAVLGTFNTRTGEFVVVPDRYFDINGRFLGSIRPAAKGTYYNNGKKIVIK